MSFTITGFEDDLSDHGYETKVYEENFLDTDTNCIEFDFGKEQQEHKSRCTEKMNDQCDYYASSPVALNDQFPISLFEESQSGNTNLDNPLVHNEDSMGEFFLDEFDNMGIGFEYEDYTNEIFPFDVKKENLDVDNFEVEKYSVFPPCLEELDFVKEDKKVIEVKKRVRKEKSENDVVEIKGVVRRSNKEGVKKRRRKKRKRVQREDVDEEELNRPMKRMKTIRHELNWEEIERKMNQRGYEYSEGKMFLAPYKTNTSINSGGFKKHYQYVILKNQRKERNLKINQINYSGRFARSMMDEYSEEEFLDMVEVQCRFCHLTKKNLETIEDNGWKKIQWYKSKHVMDGTLEKGVEFSVIKLKCIFDRERGIISLQVQIYIKGKKLRKGLCEIENKVRAERLGKKFAGVYRAKLETGDQREPKIPEQLEMTLYEKDL